MAPHGALKCAILKSINTDPILHKLVDRLLRKGGRVDAYYLRNQNKNKHAIVYLNGWFAGKNIREALQKALLK